MVETITHKLGSLESFLTWECDPVIYNVTECGYGVEKQILSEFNCGKGNSYYRLVDTCETSDIYNTLF